MTPLYQRIIDSSQPLATAVSVRMEDTSNIKFKRFVGLG